ncbi:MAG TPA: CrcB family protein [Iamia sp.]|jgi:CrcB protein|nr:CrcB family protein [Iamia sp.]
MTVAAFVLAAALGAVLRHLVATAAREARYGILVVNVAGSFVLGLLAGGDPSHAPLVVFGTGFCGALTTWSTFAHDAGTRIEQREPRPALAHLALSIALGLTAAAMGLALAGGLSR